MQWVTERCTPAGVEDYLKNIDVQVWILAMANEAQKPPQSFDDEFYQECHSLVSQQFNIDLHQDISLSNCLNVYKFLCDNI